MVEIRVGVITISDSAYNHMREDLSGPALINFSNQQGWKVTHTLVISDDLSGIYDTLISFSRLSDIDLILTTGGTGVSPRDNTPEATLRVIEKAVPGIAEHMRIAGLATNSNAILSRSVVGITNSKLIINLPGSPTGAVDCLSSVCHVIPHAIDLLHSNHPH